MGIARGHDSLEEFALLRAHPRHPHRDSSFDRGRCSSEIEMKRGVSPSQRIRSQARAGDDKTPRTMSVTKVRWTYALRRKFEAGIRKVSLKAF
jgi:hypothetical protein